MASEAWPARRAANVPGQAPRGDCAVEPTATESDFRKWEYRVIYRRRNVSRDSSIVVTVPQFGVPKGPITVDNPPAASCQAVSPGELTPQ